MPLQTSGQPLPTPVPNYAREYDAWLRKEEVRQKREDKQINLFIAVMMAIALSFLLAGVAHAGDVGPLGRVTYQARVSGTKFTDLSINTAKTTDAIKVDGWNEMTVWVKYTYSGASYVNMTCFEQRDGDMSTWYAIPMCNDASPPNSTCSLLTKQWDVDSESANWRWRIPIMGRYFRCSFITTGGDTNDKASVVYVGGQQ